MTSIVHLYSTSHTHNCFTEEPQGANVYGNKKKKSKNFLKRSLKMNITEYTVYVSDFLYLI